MKNLKFASKNVLTISAMVFGVLCGYFGGEVVLEAADIVANFSVRVMKLLAVPVLFLSLVVAVSHFSDAEQLKRLGKKIATLTIFTTLVAALIAQALFMFFGKSLLHMPAVVLDGQEPVKTSFFRAFLDMVPDNIFHAFLHNNVFAVVVIAIVLSLCLLSAEKEHQKTVFSFFLGLLGALMRAVRVALQFLPISIWAFVTILAHQISQNKTDSVNAVMALTVTVMLANLLQGAVFLPMLLKFNRISPKKLFLDVKEALILAFFSRSSAATLPVTMDCTIKNAKVNPDVARLTLSLCTTINMNGCAQFILLSVYFVAGASGIEIGIAEQIGMIFLSVIAAIGNAGVPMGCFFLASSIMASKNIPLVLMGSILPLYTLMDMVETSLNVWSDACIAKIVDKEA